MQVSDTEKFSGWHRQQHEDDSAQVSQVASNIGSLGGSVNLSAGGSYSQIASNVVAAQDINITYPAGLPCSGMVAAVTAGASQA